MKKDVQHYGSSGRAEFSFNNDRTSPKVERPSATEPVSHAASARGLGHTLGCLISIFVHGSQAFRIGKQFFASFWYGTF